MNLTTAQKSALAADIIANFAGAANTVDGSQPIADAYNAAASPAFYVWRSFVSEAEYVGNPGSDLANGGAATTWSWTAYIARSLQELNAWGRMMMTSGTGTGSGGGINPGRANIRQGIADIFSGSANSAPAQRNHITVLSKRAATRLEKLLADTSGGAGTYAAPAALGAEGSITASEAWTVRNSS